MYEKLKKNLKNCPEKFWKIDNMSKVGAILLWPFTFYTEIVF